MVLLVIGSVAALAGLGFRESSGYTVTIVGAVIAVIGLAMSGWHGEEVRARYNRTMYWSRGKMPDWAQESHGKGKIARFLSRPVKEKPKRVKSQLKWRNRPAQILTKAGMIGLLAAYILYSGWR